MPTRTTYLANREEARKRLHHQSLAPTHSLESGLLPFATIKDLSVEILSEIFILALPDDELLTHSKIESPLNVSQVSTSWRQLATSISVLWSRISFIYDNDARSLDTSRDRIKHIQQTLKTWDLWMERSKMQPLKITLRKLSLFSDVEDEAVRLLLDKAMSGFHRWHDVELKFNCTQAYLALVPDFPATLQRLALTYVHIYPISLVPTKTLSMLQGLRSGKVIGDITIPRVRAVQDAPSILKLLNLEDSVVSIRSLRYLEIHQGSAYELESILGRIKLPSLSELSIVVDRSDDTSQTGIYPMIRRSSASLKSLHLSSVGIKHDELHDVLLVSPMLETLRMDHCLHCPAEVVINTLAHSPGTGKLCPLLSKMTFTGWNITSTKVAQALTSMIESRWAISRSRHQLEAPTVTLSVTIRNCYVENPEILSFMNERLASCISEGLEFELSTFSRRRRRLAPTVGELAQ